MTQFSRKEFLAPAALLAGAFRPKKVVSSPSDSHSHSHSRSSGIEPGTVHPKGEA